MVECVRHNPLHKIQHQENQAANYHFHRTIVLKQVRRYGYLTDFGLA